MTQRRTEQRPESAVRGDIRKTRLRWILIIVGVLWPVAEASANPIAPIFVWGPGQNSQAQSFHNTTGPILADDFVPFGSARVRFLTWWGSKAGSDQWEITFHGDAGGQPAFPFLGQQFLAALGRGIGTDLFEFHAEWPQTPQDALSVQRGTTYWFSVANLAPDWTWATPAGPAPQFGTQHFLAVQSVDGDPSPVPGPHDGPWTKLQDQNFAFQIFPPLQGPEPATLALLGVGIAALAFARRRAASRQRNEADHRSS